jgi:hypothetical protein
VFLGGVQSLYIYIMFPISIHTLLGYTIIFFRNIN